MTKSTVTKLFIGGTLAAIAGAILAVLAVGIAYASDVFIMDGSDVVGVRGGGLAWSLLGVATLGALAAMGGLIAGLVSWIGALLNTWQRESKGWFVSLLLLGIFNFGFLAMIAYVLAGPDGTAEAAIRKSEVAPEATPA
jgi:hypothetical protein